MALRDVDESRIRFIDVNSAPASEEKVETTEGETAGRLPRWIGASLHLFGGTALAAANGLIGISVGETTLGTTVANLGMDEGKFPKPVFHGDTLRAHTRIISKRASKSRPGQGLVEFEHTMTNQRGEVVASCRRTGLMLGKPKA